MRSDYRNNGEGGQPNPAEYFEELRWANGDGGLRHLDPSPGGPSGDGVGTGSQQGGEDGDGPHRWS